MKKKRKSVAHVSHSDSSPFVIGTSDVLRWGDVMTINGHDLDIAKAVELGIKYGITNAEKLKKDLKSKMGLLITFPITFLMSDLQERLQKVEGLPRSKAGETLLEQVKP